MHGVADPVIEYPASAFDMENVHLKFTQRPCTRDRARSAQVQVRRSRPACYYVEHHGGLDERNSITAQYQGGNDLGGGLTQKGTASVSSVGLPEERRNAKQKIRDSRICFF